MSDLRKSDPRIEIVIDSEGGMSLEAFNYIGTGNQCEGLAVSKVLEQGLVEKRLIPEVRQDQRKFKPRSVKKTNNAVKNHLHQ
ncbi:MAG: hypothetical protein RLZZ574_75, partial [Cyanobacteriota bacterium]|jgi:hypothetical protein